MEQNVRNWSHSTSNIFKAVLMFSLGGIAAGIISSILNFIVPGLFTNIIVWLVGIVVIAGYVLYIINLGNLRDTVGMKEGAAIGQVRTAAILSIVAAILTMLNTVLWLASLFNIAAAVIMLVGFNTLKKSESLPSQARDGFSQLFTAMLLSTISWGISVILGWIPVVNIVIGIIAAILGIISFILVIMGWNNVKNSPAPTL